ncbi:hypothetical protein T01_8322 [Trichinella spiralis]|uniref:Uncharacterized protein n=1 Tax=Trichinella spiralis TaxID=6334 RepID=A0A0V1B8D4_TRISP|nr:hypothetical protein T01_8322 [Trichinella spiralis]
MDCEKLKRRRNFLKGRINCLCQNLDTSIREPGSRVDVMMTLDSISELLERCQETQDAMEAVTTDDEEQEKEIQKWMDSENEVHSARGRAEKNEEVQFEFDICQTSGLEHSELYRQSPRFPSFWEQFNAGIHNIAELADVTKFICDEILIGRQALVTRFGNLKWMTEHHIQATADLRPNGDKTLHIVLILCKRLLPKKILSLREDRILETGEDPGQVETFFEFLHKQAEIYERLHHGSPKFSRQDEMEMKKKECRRSNKVLSANVATGNPCSICRKNHQVEGCPLSLKVTKQERWALARKHRLCFCCFRQGHRTVDCKRSQNSKSVTSIGLHRLLSGDRNPTVAEENDTSHGDGALGWKRALKRNRTITYLQTAKAYLYAPNGNYTKVMCLFDTGSQRSFVTKGIADSLGLTGLSERELFLIVRRDRSTPIMSTESAAHWKKIHRQPGNIIDYYYHFIEDDRRGVDDDCLVAVKSTLEWILCGQNSRTSYTSTVKVLRIDVQPQYDCEKYRRFWKLESIEFMDQPEVESPVERSMTINRELSFHKARYVTRLFWKRCSASLNNYHAALKRFEQLKARLRKELTKKREYKNTLREYIDNGYVEEIGNLDGREGRTWYLPHRAVFKMDKNTSKCRIILMVHIDIQTIQNQYPVRHHEDVLTNRTTPRGPRCDKICMAETGRRDAISAVLTCPSGPLIVPMCCHLRPRRGVTTNCSKTFGMNWKHSTKLFSFWLLRKGKIIVATLKVQANVSRQPVEAMEKRIHRELVETEEMGDK